MTFRNQDLVQCAHCFVSLLSRGRGYLMCTCVMYTFVSVFLYLCICPWVHMKCCSLNSTPQECCYIFLICNTVFWYLIPLSLICLLGNFPRLANGAHVIFPYICPHPLCSLYSCCPFRSFQCKIMLMSEQWPLHCLCVLVRLDTLWAVVLPLSSCHCVDTSSPPSFDSPGCPCLLSSLFAFEVSLHCVWRESVLGHCSGSHSRACRGGASVQTRRSAQSTSFSTCNRVNMQDNQKNRIQGIQTGFSEMENQALVDKSFNTSDYDLKESNLERLSVMSALKMFQVSEHFGLGILTW